MADERSAKPTIKKASPPTQSKKPSPKHKFEGHEDEIRSFVFLHDGKHIVSGSEDGTMRKWDCETGLLVGTPWEGEGGGIWAVALSPNGNIIACGRNDGSIQQWNTDGKIIKGVWTGHSGKVRSVSWSPSGGHIASGSTYGTILIRKAESGEVELGPIKAEQDCVESLAYSPPGDRIASGGHNGTICIWNSNTGDLLVGPIEALGNAVTSVVWSSDSSKLYSASDEFARVFDSVSGTELHRFEQNVNHSLILWSVALSPKHNILAFVGIGGIAQLWDTKSYQPLGMPFSTGGSANLCCVSFSRDGRYLAYGGNDKKITLWLVKDIALALPDTRPQLDADATRRRPVARRARDGRDDFYRDFFQPSQRSHQPGSYRPSRPDECPGPSRARFWSILIPSRHRHREGKPSANHDLPLKLPVGSLGNHPTSTESSYRRRHATSSEVVEVPVARGFQRLVTWKRKHKTKSKPPAQNGSTASMAATSSQAASAPIPHASGSSQTSESCPGQAGTSSQPAGGSTSHVVETHDSGDDSDSDSDSSIQGSWNKFLVRLCFPRGRYHDDTQ